MNKCCNEEHCEKPYCAFPWNYTNLPHRHDEIEPLLKERSQLLFKWQTKGLWIWEKIKLDKLDHKIAELMWV